MLKSQDILVLLKLVAIGQKAWSYGALAHELGMSQSEVHAALKRAVQSELAIKRDNSIIPNLRNLEEFLVHGLKYAFIPQRGALVRGMPTAHAAPPLDQSFIQDHEPPPVWPDPEGSERGMAFSPLYKSVPKAARQDNDLYELLVLIDAIRGGQARDRDIANKELRKRLKQYEKDSKPKS